MSITIRCPACRASLRLDDALAGRKVRCSSCREPIFVDDPDDDDDDRRPARTSLRRPAVDQPLLPPRRARVDDDDEDDDKPGRPIPVWKREMFSAGIYFAVIGGITVLSIGTIVICTSLFSSGPAVPPVVPPPNAQPLLMQNPAEAQLAAQLMALNNPNPGLRIAAAQSLRGMNPNTPRRDEVARALAAGIKDANPSYVEAAAGALEVWATTAVSRELVEGLEAGSESVRRSCLRALATIKDPGTYGAIAKRLTSPDRDEAAGVLRGLGQPAEAAVLPYVSNDDREARRDACRILARIGSSASIAALEARQSDPDPVVRGTANSAIRQIRRRNP